MLRYSQPAQSSGHHIFYFVFKLLIYLFNSRHISLVSIIFYLPFFLLWQVPSSHPPFPSLQNVSIPQTGVSACIWRPVFTSGDPVSTAAAQGSPFTTWLWRAAGRSSAPATARIAGWDTSPHFLRKRLVWPEGQALRSLCRCSQGS